MTLTGLMIYGGIGFVALVVIGLILTRMYRRAPKDAALVRTGFGGEKVIMNGGTIVLPVLHELMEVSLKTVKLVVSRSARDSLITLDKFRVDVSAIFHVRVAPNVEAVSAAAQTLGQAINDPGAIKNLLEEKIISALRSVAATMNMEDIHVNRADFTQKVQQTLQGDLSKNGFELETVSLTHYDQTPIDHLNPDSAFDAVGLTKVREITEQNRKVRNEIEAETRVAIEERNREANARSLEIAEQDRQATLEQEKRVKTMEAETNATIATEQAQRAQEAEQARIDAENATKLREIAANQAQQAADLEREKFVELTRQQTSVETAKKSKEESVAKKEADVARADAIKASESVVTAKVTAEAERQKSVAVIKASEDAERQAVGIRVAAAAEKDAATDRAEAARLLAEGEANAALVRAEGESKAILVKADADERQYAVEAEGKSKLNAAENLLAPGVMDFRRQLAVVEAMPKIIEQSVRPLEKIESIRIVQVAGLGGTGGGESSGGSSGNLAEDAVQAAMKYQYQAPLIRGLMASVGLDSFGEDGFSPVTTPAAPSPSRRPKREPEIAG